MADWSAARGPPAPVRTFDRKSQAIDRGREIAQHQGTELVILSRDGQMQSKNSHGHDSFPPQGLMNTASVSRPARKNTLFGSGDFLVSG